MKLKHLIDDRELTLAILSRWDYDEEHLGLLDRFRISANAVYPFRAGGTLQFLRFAPEDEKMPEQIASELAFINYLRDAGYAANRPVPSRAGQLLESIDTAKGRYHAVAFEGVPGRQLDPETMTPADFAGWGRALAELHRLSMDYSPPEGLRRHDWRDNLDWAEGVLKGLPGEDRALAEVMLIRQALASLPATRGDYGLIHYDFETDNVFLDPATGTFSVIDFDVATYHWFVMDAYRAINSAGDIDPGRRAAFFEGYRRVIPLSEAMLAREQLFARFTRIWGYARLQWSVADGPEGAEPEWMVSLRGKIAALVASWVADFGKPL